MKNTAFEAVFEIRYGFYQPIIADYLENPPKSK